MCANIFFYFFIYVVSIKLGIFPHYQTALTVEEHFVFERLKVPFLNIELSGK